jgi:hypothetical protein
MVIIRVDERAIDVENRCIGHECVARLRLAVLGVHGVPYPRLEAPNRRPSPTDTR